MNKIEKLSEKEIIKKLETIIIELLESTRLFKAINRRFEDLYYGMDWYYELMKPDLIIEVETRDFLKYFLIFEVKSTGEPRYARMAISQLQSYLKNKEKAYGIFCAPFISEETKKLCFEAGIGCIDLAGNCFFKFDNVYINVEGKPNLYPATRSLKSILGLKSTRALRVLLCEPSRYWLVKDLAKAANISLGQTSNLKNRLLEYELIEEGEKQRKGKKFRLSNPEILLRKWSDNYSYLKNKIKNFYSFDEVLTVEKKLAEYCNVKEIQYAFTLTSGANWVAPMLRYKRVFAYVTQDRIDEVAKELAFKEVSSGPNVSLLEPCDEGVFYGIQEIEGMKVVSDIQLYLDLQSYRERGEEAAEFLLEQRLKKLW